MKYLKNVALLLVMALSLTIGTSGAAAETPPYPVQEPSSTSVDFLFGQSWGQVSVHAMPGSFYSVKAPGPDGQMMVLANGSVDQTGMGRSMFPVMPSLNIHSITVTVVSPGQPPMLFVYDSDLDRWILD